MKIIFKNKQEFLNTLYGDEEDYSYITKRDIKEIIKGKLKSLDRIYEYLDDTDLCGEEQYDLGDCENLIQLFENIEFKNNRTEKKIEEIILNFIGENYGSQEMDDPCYNIKELSRYIVKELEI